MRPDRSFSKVLALAATAPSVHNSQPWLLREGPDGSVDLLADFSRQVPHADPTQRELFASLGAFLETAAWAAAGMGNVLRVERTPALRRRHVARLSLAGRVRANPESLAAVRARRTLRVPYHARELGAATARELAPGTPEVSVALIDSPTALARLARSVAAATRRAFSDPAFREELARQLVADQGAGGILGSARGAKHLLRQAQALGLKHVDLGALQASQRRRCVVASSAVLLFSTRGDGAADWLSAGEAMCRSWLVAVRMGLSGQPMTAAVESPEEREELSRFSGGGFVQAMLRVGRSNEVAPDVPRRPFEELWT